MTTTRNLLWKEWREQRWAAAFGAVSLGGFTAIALRARVLSDAEILAFTAIFSIFGLPLVIALAPLAGERSAGTLGMLAGLPMRTNRIFWVKAVVAFATLAVALTGPAIVGLVMSGGRELVRTWIISHYLVMFWLGAQLLAWTWGIGAGQSSEARIGLAGVGVIALWCLGALLADEVFEKIFGRWVWEIQPLSIFDQVFDGHKIGNYHLWLIHGAIGAAMLVWAARRYGRAIGAGR